MGKRQSAEVTHALKLVAKGMTPYAAAKKVGIALSTIYRAIDRHPELAAIRKKLLAEMQAEVIALHRQCFELEVEKQRLKTEIAETLARAKLNRSVAIKRSKA